MKRKIVMFAPTEKELLDYALSKDNFSNYIKSLIKTDIVETARENKIVKPSRHKIYSNKIKSLFMIKKIMNWFKKELPIRRNKINLEVDESQWRLRMFKNRGYIVDRYSVKRGND